MNFNKLDTFRHLQKEGFETKRLPSVGDFLKNV